MNRNADRSSSPSNPSRITSRYTTTVTGQEFNLVLEGRHDAEHRRQRLDFKQKGRFVFQLKLPHGMKALDGKKVRFLAVTHVTTHK